MPYAKTRGFDIGDNIPRPWILQKCALCTLSRLGLKTEGPQRRQWDDVRFLRHSRNNTAASAASAIYLLVYGIAGGKSEHDLNNPYARFKGPETSAAKARLVWKHS